MSKRIVFVVTGLVVGLFSQIASSHTGGTIGVSGKFGTTCSSCHAGGEAPTVELTGPTSLEAGVTATYTFTIRTNAAVVGMNAAADGAGLAADSDPGLRVDGDEVTHVAPRPPDGGAAAFTFTMTPSYGGNVQIYAAGNAANGDGQPTGDETAVAQLTVTVDGPPRPKSNELPPSSGTQPTPPAPVPPTSIADAGSDASVASPGEGPGASASGCAVEGSSSSRALSGCALGGVGVVALVMTTLRRRRAASRQSADRATRPRR